MDGVYFESTPANPDLLLMVFVQQVLLLIAFILGLFVRYLLRGRARISVPAATLTALIGLWIGLYCVGWVFDTSQEWSFGMIGTASLVAMFVVAIVALVLTAVQHEKPLPPIAEVARGGESDRLEFKSTARWNIRENKRDEAMETVIAKTVTAFLNSAGGTLLIGVDDDGRLIGLDSDYATLKQPDADRFELWIRDMLGQRVGANAAALPCLDFAPAHDGSGEVCRVTVPPSPFPVFLLGPKGKGVPELWVRVGNSTRRLEVDDAVTYVAHRWPSVARPSLRVRLAGFLLRRRVHFQGAALPGAVASSQSKPRTVRE